MSEPSITPESLKQGIFSLVVALCQAQGGVSPSQARHNVAGYLDELAHALRTEPPQQGEQQDVGTT